MTTTIPDIGAYPKTMLLRDETRVVMRPLTQEDAPRLLSFFQKIPEEERYYLKEDVVSAEVIQKWCNNIDFDRVIPIVALVDDEIIADATLHRSRALARRHFGELRVVVDPAYREIGLGRRLIGELLDIAVELGLWAVEFELVAHHENLAIAAAKSMGFQVSALLKERIRDLAGDPRDLVIMELPLWDYQLSYRF
jgi:L-amino acid N-acyltransferase YncA